jgi:TonB family protein
MLRVLLSALALLLTVGSQPARAAQADDCRPAPTPLLLPAFDQVVDSVALADYVVGETDSTRAMGVLLALRFGEDGALERIAMLESTVPPDEARPVGAAVGSLVRPQPPGRVWGIRVWVESGPAPGFGVARSELCEPVPVNSPQLLSTTILVDAVELEEMRRAGAFVVRMLVSDKGHVLQANLVRSSGSNLNDDAVMRNARTLRFRPGTLDGAPFEMWTEVRFEPGPRRR